MTNGIGRRRRKNKAKSGRDGISGEGRTGRSQSCKTNTISVAGMPHHSSVPSFQCSNLMRIVRNKPNSPGLVRVASAFQRKSYDSLRRSFGPEEQSQFAGGWDIPVFPLFLHSIIPIFQRSNPLPIARNGVARLRGEGILGSETRTDCAWGPWSLFVRAQDTSVLKARAGCPRDARAGRPRHGLGQPRSGLRGPQEGSTPRGNWLLTGVGAATKMIRSFFTRSCSERCPGSGRPSFSGSSWLDRQSRATVLQSSGPASQGAAMQTAGV